MKPTLADWRAQVEKEGGALEHQAPEGVAVQPLYTEGPDPSPVTRGLGSIDAKRFGVCMRVDPVKLRRPGALEEDIDGGADALWIDGNDIATMDFANQRGLHLITEIDFSAKPDLEAADGDVGDFGSAWLGFDPIAAVARGTIDARILGAGFLRSLVPMVEDLGDARTRTVRVSSLPFHSAGADAADELALMLSSLVAYLGTLLSGGVDRERAAGQVWFQIAVGRDTFGELCKLRALRLVADKVFAASGITAATPPIHAVCSPRTQSQCDPWVNMLRVTTETFAAILGGADMVTPRSFDDALGLPSALGRRTARNTALVLRDESHLGAVLDAGGGSYYIESRTDALAREAWSRFQTLERDGGIVKLLASGGLRQRLDAAWGMRASAIAKRKEPVLGVSEFANLGEQLPARIPEPPAQPAAPALATHRDAELFEALRARAVTRPHEVVLVTLGPASEHRARVGFATACFATAGLHATEHASDAPFATPPDLACLCGSDERYASEAVAHAAALRAAGARKIVLAGRPGTLERELRAAGVSAFIFIGCDVVATLKELTS